MGSKLISQITATQTTINDTDYFELEEAGGTSKKTVWSTIKSNLKTYLDGVYSSIPVGTSVDFSGTVIPSGWMTEDGSSLLRPSYPTLYSALTSTIGTCTISIASPGVVSYTLHPFITGDCVHFTTTGELPSGLSPSTGYYVIAVDGNTFRLATTYNDALTGTAINTGGTQSGTHTLVWSPWNIADATHFYIPDTRGLLVEGNGVQGYTSWAGVNYTGRLGQYKQDQMQQITGTFETITPNIYTFTGAFSSVTGQQANDSGGANSGRGRRVSFTTENSPNARTGFITNGPRVGKNRIIRVL